MDGSKETQNLQLRSRAWELVDQGVCSRDPAERVRLGHQALQIFEGCSGAYLLLAEGNIHCDPEEAVALCQRGVQTAEASMGFPVDTVKQAAPGDLFHMPASKRYVEAVAALAHSLHAAGRRSEAIGRAFEVLELDSSDHLSISHALIEWLMEDGRDDEAVGVLQSLPCPCAHHAYSRALLTFRTFGERDRRAAWALKLALDNNSRVPAYLLAKTDIPAGIDRASREQRLQPDMEAARYASKSAGLWASTPGALQWLEALSSDANLLEDKISPSSQKPWPGTHRGEEVPEGRK